MSELASSPWAYLVDELSESIHDPFEIRDFRCDEFEKLLSSSEDNPSKQYDLCLQLFQYLHDQYAITSKYYSASIVVNRGRYSAIENHIRGIVSSFCSLLKRSNWIPIFGGKLSQPGEVYCLPTNNNAFREYVPHIDFTKLRLTDFDFIYNILGIQQQVAPRTIFELLMNWSCHLDSESLWNLVKENRTSEM